MADQQDDGCGAEGVVVEGGERGAWTCSLRGGGFGDGDAWGGGVDAGGDEFVGEQAERASGHVDDERCIGRERALPLGRDLVGWRPCRGAAWCAVAKMSFEAELRSVSGVLSAAATAKAAVMPGTISKGMPASLRAAISSPARPKTRGSPDLRRTTVRFARACSSMRSWISAWVMRGWPQRLPTGMISAGCGRHAELASARISSETRSSGRITSAV